MPLLMTACKLIWEFNAVHDEAKGLQLTVGSRAFAQSFTWLLSVDPGTA